jgi:energy-coupling factor transporter ATP-binding protein EcfA2
LDFAFSIPTASGNKDFELKPGESLIFVGANGGGKTRLAVYIEEALGSVAKLVEI